MKPDSEELAKARVRMIREMIKARRLTDVIANGFTYSNHEYSEARLGLVLNAMGNYEYLPVPESAKFYKEKNIKWKHVEDWEGVKLHELPLQGCEDVAPQNGIKSMTEEEADEDGDEKMSGVSADEDSGSDEESDSDSSDEGFTAEEIMADPNPKESPFRNPEFV